MGFCFLSISAGWSFLAWVLVLLHATVTIGKEYFVPQQLNSIQKVRDVGQLVKASRVITSNIETHVISIIYNHIALLF